MASFPSMKRLSFQRYAAVHRWTSIILVLLCLKEAYCERASCGNSQNTAGSGINSMLICGDNSDCLNNAVCQCDSNSFTVSGTHTDCQSIADPNSQCVNYDLECIYCGLDSAGPCQACTSRLVLFNGRCLSSCPADTQLEVLRTINNISIVHQTCTGSSSSTVLPEWGLIIIVVLGSVILITIAILITTVACAYLRRSSVGQLNIAERQKANTVVIEGGGKPGSIEQPDVSEGGGIMEDYFESDTIKLSEEETDEFFSKLAVLRGEAETFLKMLNDMRKRLKELPPTSPSTQQYKDVMRDLTRLLYILNKKPQTVRIPPDGIQLLDWSEQILNRYLAAQGKPTIDIRAASSTVRSLAVSNPNRISVIGDQAMTRF